MNDRDLIILAAKARERAYAPYSDFSVGAALLTHSGKVYDGCNIENSAFSPTVCAERVAFFKAVSEGERDFEAIAIVGGKTESDAECPPCGVCRQVMSEFCSPDFRIVLGSAEKYRTYSLSDLLPLSFGLSERGN